MPVCSFPVPFISLPCLAAPRRTSGSVLCRGPGWAARPLRRAVGTAGDMSLQGAMPSGGFLRRGLHQIHEVSVYP